MRDEKRPGTFRQAGLFQRAFRAEDSEVLDDRVVDDWQRADTAGVDCDPEPVPRTRSMSGRVMLKSLSSLSSNAEPVPRQIELTFGPRLASFGLACVIYFASCQETLGLEPIVRAVGLGLQGLATLVTFSVVGGAVLYFIWRRGLGATSDPPSKG
jgi:hypothetical protein